MSKTMENLKAAFAGESEARNKYTFFAEVARKEGYRYIAKIFEETAENEMQHAKDHLLLLDGIGDTLTNLKEAWGGEDHEVESMYPEFVKIAEEEGQTAAAMAFKQVAKIEAHHRARFNKLIEIGNYSLSLFTLKRSPFDLVKSTTTSLPPKPSTRSCARTRTIFMLSGIFKPLWLRVKGCSYSWG